MSMKNRYYIRNGDIPYATIYIIMDGNNDRKIAECYYKEDAEIIVKVMNRAYRKAK